MIIRLLQITLLASLLCTGCSIYRLEVQQGNYISEENIAKVQPGMSREQVQEILGTPLLTDDFRKNRWDYVFYVRDNNQINRRNGVTVFFNGAGEVSQLRRDKAAS